MTIRVLIVDDDPDIRESVRIILDAEEDIVVVAEAESGARAVGIARRIAADVALVDVNMPGRNGIETTRDLLELPEPPKVLILTAFATDSYTLDALGAGASGYLLKNFRPGELPDAVRTVARGESVLAPAVTSAVIGRVVAAQQAAEAGDKTDDLADLTDRERDLIRAIALGMSNNQIAAHLTISPASVRTYVSRLLDKLGLSNRTQLAILAHRAGLVD
jgi:DNA-binding NarL/FixJ family response regulator